MSVPCWLANRSFLVLNNMEKLRVRTYLASSHVVVIAVVDEVIFGHIRLVSILVPYSPKTCGLSTECFSGDRSSQEGVNMMRRRSITRVCSSRLMIATGL
jgi:hypothetical protein